MELGLSHQKQAQEASNFFSRHSGALALIGKRFPEEICKLVKAAAPPLARRATARWYKSLCIFICHLSELMEEDSSTSASMQHGLWLQRTTYDIGLYCGHVPAGNEALLRDTISQHEKLHTHPVFYDPSSQPHLQWCQLRVGLVDAVAARVRGRAQKVWRSLARWFRQGFSLHYHGPSRATPPTHQRLLQQAVNKMHDSIKPRLYLQVRSLMEEQGPMFGPYPRPPYNLGIVSPILGVEKKDGSVRAVYHCSYPHGQHGPCEAQSLNGGISKASYWFPTYDSVATLVLQWYFEQWAWRNPSEGGTGTNDFVVFKLDFSSAFRQVPIRQEDWPLLMLYDSSSESYVLETCAAFGTRISADLWLRIANLWKLCLFERGYTSLIIYVDDLALICHQKALAEVFRLVGTLEQRLGTQVHWGKIFPDGGCTSCATVLGVTVDVGKCILHLDPVKARQRLHQIERLLSTTTWGVKDVERLVGALNFFATALPTGRMLLGPLYALVYSKKERVRVLQHHLARRVLQAWQDVLSQAIVLKQGQPMFYTMDNVFWIATDASDMGLGGCSPFGAWSSGTADLDVESINVREFFALWVSVTQIWPEHLQGKLVHAFIDNESARAWAGHAPSSTISRDSWLKIVKMQHSLAVCLQQIQCSLVLHRIPTHDNVIADELSRRPGHTLQPQAISDWYKTILTTVNSLPDQSKAQHWLQSRMYETPLLWWDTKSTALGMSVPGYVRTTINPPPSSPGDVFPHRPLLCSLLQQPLDPQWCHDIHQRPGVKSWWRLVNGQQGASM